MPTPRRTRATSVAATKEAEPPSRRTRAASVSANKRPEVVKKAVATPKRKRSASAAPRAAPKARDVDRALKSREKGRAKRARTDAGEDDGRRGRRAEREEEEEQTDFDNDKLSPWLLAELQATMATHDESFRIFQRSVGTASVKGLSAAKKREEEEAFEQLWEDEKKLQRRSQDWPNHQKGDSCCLVHESEKRKAKLLEWGRRLADVRSLDGSDQATTMTQEEKFQRHQEERKEFVKTARLALAGQMSEDLKAELIRMHESVAQAERDFKRAKTIGDELTEIGWRLKAEKTAEQIAKEEAPKKDQKIRVKGAYLDTTAQGYERAPILARQHRAQQKLIAEEMEKAGKVLEDLKEEFVKGLEFRADGGTNIAKIDGQQDFRYQLWLLQGEYKDLQKEREDLEKIKSFNSKVIDLIQRQRMAKDGTGEALMTDGNFVNVMDAEIMPDSMESIHDEDVAAHAPSTARKPRLTEGKPKKTPRRKSIRMGALSIFTPNGTRANSEAVEDIPSSPLSPPPHILEAPAIDENDPAVRAPGTISWATPVSEIQAFLTNQAGLSLLLPDRRSFNFDTRPIGFKCPGHKREWRGAEQTRDLIIYREWLNESSNIGKEEFYGFFMSPRDISKPPTLENMKSLKDWKAWGASVVTQGKNRTLVIYDPELSAEEVMRVKKTGELTKMQQLLVGAVKRCRGSCDEVKLAGRTPEDDERKKEVAAERDSFTRTAEWAAKIISDGQMNVSRSIKKLEIAK